MPVPAPRNQYGPISPAARNPDGELPDRFNRWGRPPPVEKQGETPGLMFITRRGCVLGAGQVRRMWQQTIGYIPAPPPYSWTASSPEYSAVRAVGVTRALRYMTRSISPTAGTDNTRFSGLHTQVLPSVRSLPVTVGRGQTRERPTVRNRMTSFGARVPTLNQPAPAGQGG